MKFLIQNVDHARVSVDGQTVGQIGKGMLVLVGVADSDTPELADRMTDKLIGMRIFADAEGKTNLSAADIGGEFLIVSQFTLFADCHKGNRPSFIHAGRAELAYALYQQIIERIRVRGFVTQTGRFGTPMKVELCNDGPFTIMLDSDEIFR